MRCLRCILLFALTATVLSVCAAAAFVAFVPGWLAAAEVPEKADAIVVLTGAPERVLLSRAAPDRHTPLLARFGLQAMPEEEAGLRILTMSGVPARQIEILGAGSKSTLEEMESLRAHLHGPARLLVVTSPLHVRRAGMIARSVLHGSGLETIFVATPCKRIPALVDRSGGGPRCLAGSDRRRAGSDEDRVLPLRRRLSSDSQSIVSSATSRTHIMIRAYQRCAD